MKKLKKKALIERSRIDAIPVEFTHVIPAEAGIQNLIEEMPFGVPLGCKPPFPRFRSSRLTGCMKLAPRSPFDTSGRTFKVRPVLRYRRVSNHERLDGWRFILDQTDRVSGKRLC
jgi:hypothetical protein